MDQCGHRADPREHFHRKHHFLYQMRLLHNQQRGSVNTFGKEIEYGETCVKTQCKGQMSLAGRAPANLEYMPKDEGIDHQHQQWCQNQPSRTKPRLAVMNVHLAYGQLANEAGMAKRQQVRRQEFQTLRLMKLMTKTYPNNRTRPAANGSGFWGLGPTLRNFFQYLGSQDAQCMPVTLHDSVDEQELK